MCLCVDEFDHSSTHAQNCPCAVVIPQIYCVLVAELKLRRDLQSAVGFFQINNVLLLFQVLSLIFNTWVTAQDSEPPCEHWAAFQSMLLTISIMRGEITSGSMSWICRTCLVYSSVMVLNWVRQATTLGYIKLRDSRQVILLRVFLSGKRSKTGPHLFSGPDLLHSMNVFRVNARFSWNLSMVLCSCTPWRSGRIKQTQHAVIRSDATLKKKAVYWAALATWQGLIIYTVGESLANKGEWLVRSSCYLEKTGTGLALKRTLRPAGPPCAVSGGIWAQAPAAAGNPLQHTRPTSHSLIMQMSPLWGK